MTWGRRSCDRSETPDMHRLSHSRITHHITADERDERRSGAPPSRFTDIPHIVDAILDALLDTANHASLLVFRTMSPPCGWQPTSASSPTSTSKRPTRPRAYRRCRLDGRGHALVSMYTASTEPGRLPFIRGVRVHHASWEWDASSSPTAVARVRAPPHRRTAARRSPSTAVLFAAHTASPTPPTPRVKHATRRR